ncbi:MAG: peptide deformylase [Elusimicrobiota bacterium]|nr:peptide deformylase [Elusimicrobiota bacterium]
MAVLRITKHGEKVLKTVCPPADYAALAPRLPELLRDMWATMRAARGVGLAAPQIGLSLRLAVIDTRPDGKSDPLVLINPEIVSAEGQLKDEEGCLSVPGVYSKLQRFAKVRVRALDADGKVWERTGEGLLARAFQHEIDHLDGKLYVDRLPFEDRLRVLDVIKGVRVNWD